MSMLAMMGAAVVGSLLTFLAAHYWFEKSERVKKADRLEEANNLLLARVTELESGHALLRQAAMPINAVVQAMLIKELTHDHGPRLDALLEKIGPPCQLSEDEERELEKLLDDRANQFDERVSPSERDAARMLMMVVARARSELLPSSTVIMVSLPGEPK